jgi:hypothetical protein
LGRTAGPASGPVPLTHSDGLGCAAS